MSDIFEATKRKYAGSPAVVILFVLAFLMLVIGLNHLIEDTFSSYYGLKSLEEFYKMKVQIFDWTYWTMSLAPQVASMVFFYMYLSDTSKKSLLVMSLGAQAMDFFADSWYRSGGKLFYSFEVFTVSSLLTFIYFSIGSEFFTTVGGGLVLKLAAPALQTWKVTWNNIKRAKNMAYQPEGGGEKKQGKDGGDRRERDIETERKRRHEDMRARFQQAQQKAKNNGQKEFHFVKREEGDN